MESKGNAQPFGFVLTIDEWLKIKPKEDLTFNSDGRRGLQPGWTDIFENKLRHVNPNCLRWYTGSVKKPTSRKVSAPFFTGRASCRHPDCTLIYKLTIEEEPTASSTSVDVIVTPQGNFVALDPYEVQNRADTRMERREYLRMLEEDAQESCNNADEISWMSNRRNRISDLGVLLLAHQLFTTSNIPPVTLSAILAQVAIFLGFVPFLDVTRTAEMCVLPSRIWFNGEWWRLVFPTLMHADDMHLYYNMVSFLWKGRRLERRLGSAYFAYLLVIFSLLTNITIVLLSILLGDAYLNQCAVGFSGVIFALKTLTNHYYPNEDAWLLGRFPIPSKYACWIELLIIQVLVPNASFLGHLAGIIVGLTFAMGPLKLLMDTLFTAFSGQHGFDTRPAFANSNRDQPNDHFYEYTGGLSEEEQIRRAMDESSHFHRNRRPSPSAPPVHDNSTW